MSQGRGQHYDVVVVGGGAAGIAAAVGARRAGARTLLVEHYGFLGGAATNANVLSYCGFYTRSDERRRVVGGAGARVLDALAELGFDVAPIRAPSGNWIVMLDPEALKYALDRIVAEDGIDCRLHCTLIGASRAAARIDAVTLFDHAGAFEVAASCFVDASGDADLGFAAGVPLLTEPLAQRQRQLASFPVRIGGVPPQVDVSRATLLSLMEHFDAGDARAHVRRNGGHFFRLPRSGELWWMGIDLATDGLDSADLAAAERGGRDLAWKFFALLRARVPGFEQAYIGASGPGLGIRDSRQLQTRYRITGEDVLSGRTRDDGIACGCWPAELHRGTGGPTFQPVGGEGYYHVPLAAIRASAVDNLWVAGRAIGCDELAYGSLRVMGTAFATGQAAGVAAAQVALGGSAEDPGRIRQDLLQQGAIL
jgi:hypothetical protein